MIHNFSLDSDEVISEFQFDLLKQTNLIITKLFQVKNKEVKNDFFEFGGDNLKKFRKRLRIIIFVIL